MSVHKIKAAIAAVLVLALVVLVGAASAEATYKPKPKVVKKYVCHDGETIKVPWWAVKFHLYHGDTYGKCPPVEPPQEPPTTPAGGNRVLLCMPYLVIRSGDGTLGLSADVPIDVTDEAPWTDGKIARSYEGVGATCDQLGGTKVADGFFNRGANYEYEVWRR